MRIFSCRAGIGLKLSTISRNTFDALKSINTHVDMYVCKKTNLIGISFSYKDKTTENNPDLIQALLIAHEMRRREAMAVSEIHRETTE